ncbi:tetratricopeptide repeat protein 6 [Eulemur rufifrons]|uniref:tetratricopeptide repeat protein 6 n=1 Tax=Eulemur rufifrons TaxID=859984 RepID=UPI0037447216
MSTIPKHFGLKHKEESHMFKELEKVRQETKKDFLRFKQKLASKQAVDEGSVHSLRASSPAHPRCVSYAGPGTSKESSPAKGLEISSVAILQEALGGAARPSGRAAPGNTRVFQPRNFYLRSSAFLRHGAQKPPPVIASGVGTAKPAVLLPPPTPRARPTAHGTLESPRPAASRRDLDLARGREASQEIAPSAGVYKAKESKASSLSSEDSDAEASGRRRRVKISTHLVREGEGSAGKAREAAVSVPRGERESRLLSHALEAAGQTLLPARVTPKSIEEIIVSLQSEAQLASDQIIKELIQSVLGQNYDIKMEVGEPE